MNFWYDEEDYNDVIKKYAILNDQIIIILYLNGDIKLMEYSEDVEKEILETMLLDAQRRDINIPIELLKKKLRENNAKIFLELMLSVTNLISANSDMDNIKLKYMSAFMSIILSTIALFEHKKNGKLSGQIEELEKYKLYLSMRKELEENYDEATFRGIKAFDGLFNINTLDNYTLSEVKRIRKNLDNNK